MKGVRIGLLGLSGLTGLTLAITAWKVSDKIKDCSEKHLQNLARSVFFIGVFLVGYSIMRGSCSYICGCDESRRGMLTDVIFLTICYISAMGISLNLLSKRESCKQIPGSLVKIMAAASGSAFIVSTAVYSLTDSDPDSYIVTENGDVSKITGSKLAEIRKIEKVREQNTKDKAANEASLKAASDLLEKTRLAKAISDDREFEAAANAEKKAFERESRMEDRRIKLENMRLDRADEAESRAETRAFEKREKQAKRKMDKENEDAERKQNIYSQQQDRILNDTSQSRSASKANLNPAESMYVRSRSYDRDKYDDDFFPTTTRSYTANKTPKRNTRPTRSE
jgi:hypothetical protein